MGVILCTYKHDTVATEEIKFGDNDRLAAHPSNDYRGCLVLILLSDIDGLYG